MSLPEIRIKNAWLLRDHASEHLNELWGDGTPLRTHEEYETIVATYQKAWWPYEQKILQGMCDTFGLTFRQAIIDVYIAPWFSAFSDPMVIGVTNKPDRFVEILTHELLHRLLTDNVQTAYDTEYDVYWRELFGKELGWNVLLHIPVHAGLQAVFDDVLHEPKRTERDQQESKEWPDYNAAWEYVEKHGYKEIVQQLKDSYKNLAIKEKQ